MGENIAEGTGMHSMEPRMNGMRFAKLSAHLKGESWLMLLEGDVLRAS
jgi:hypothetical protein